ncbi:hypothetical protein D027_0807B, partial [Vibrio parahaemolyticus 861]
DFSGWESVFCQYFTQWDNVFCFIDGDNRDDFQSFQLFFNARHECSLNDAKRRLCECFGNDGAAMLNHSTCQCVASLT